MKWDLKGTVNMKLQGGEMVKLNDVLQVPQAVKNILNISSIESKGSTMGATKDKMTINKNSVNMNLDAIKGKYESTIFYLKTRR